MRQKKKKRGKSCGRHKTECIARRLAARRCTQTLKNKGYSERREQQKRGKESEERGTGSSGWQSE